MNIAKVAHASDWHGEWRQLPVADLYVFTGDMLRNFPSIAWDGSHPRRVIDHDKESKMQTRWLLEEERKGGLRRWLGNPSAPVITVRGNHDFADIGPFFGGDFWEVDLDPSRTHEWRGLKVGGCRGINFLCGEWADEIQVEAWGDHASQIPADLDILVTHAPPYMVQDYEGDHYGVRALRGYVDRRVYSDDGRPLVHMFGHVHAARGTRIEGNITFSNAAQGMNVLKFEVP